ncbi:oxalate decarboxylase [Ophiostoma piceae UAMH 11346]|uniref:Oxalate decarboxylase n=1 Tax=Ophiostoma piceae (strain UAMH 11346) TaxID=1262450 RepID=S3CDG9_OPHP1|nr:oxalate decarboxylase [Ophiostoma piceae UAMH 11346]
MKLPTWAVAVAGLFLTADVACGLSVEKRASIKPQPIDGNGKGAPIVGGTNAALDAQNPDNLGQLATQDAGTVPNLKWSFSDSKTKLFRGGWSRETVVTDLPASDTVAAAQQHLKKGALRELHWHRVAEWGIVYAGSILLSAVDENGQYQVEKLEYGDIWYFPKGVAHTVQGLDEENEYLLVFDDANFDKVGTTFMVDDWVAHTPKAILAKNFGVDASVFDTVPATDPYIINGTVSEANETTANPPAFASSVNSSTTYVYRTFQHEPDSTPGGGGQLHKIDSRVFPIAQTIAAAVVSLKPGGLRELHWHPNAQEWLYFHNGTARATVFIGSGNARTFDFGPGDTAAFPDNSGHYIENTSDTEDLVWIEIYKSDRVADISLTQWLALTPADIVAQTLKVPISFVHRLKKEKQVLLS